MDALRTTALVLILIGALNWGLVGLFNFDLVNAVFGGNSVYQPSALARIVYIVIAIAGLVGFTFFRVGGERERVKP